MQTDTLSRRVGQLLRALRQERRWSLDAASANLNMRPSTLGAYERGHRKMAVDDSLEKLVAGYGLTLLQFWQRLYEPERSDSTPDGHERILMLADIIARSSAELATLVAQQPVPPTRAA